MKNSQHECFESILIGCKLEGAMLYACADWSDFGGQASLKIVLRGQGLVPTLHASHSCLPSLDFSLDLLSSCPLFPAHP